MGVGVNKWNENGLGSSSRSVKMGMYMNGFEGRCADGWMWQKGM